MDFKQQMNETPSPKRPDKWDYMLLAGGVFCAVLIWIIYHLEEINEFFE